MGDIYWNTCPYKGCGHSPFPLDQGFVDRARRTHETFRCPAGHSQGFYGQSREEELAAEVKSLRRRIDWWENRLVEEAGTCPWPGCEFRAKLRAAWDKRPLLTHLRAAHGAPTMAEVRAAEEVA